MTTKTRKQTKASNENVKQVKGNKIPKNIAELAKAKNGRPRKEKEPEITDNKVKTGELVKAVADELDITLIQANEFYKAFRRQIVKQFEEGHDVHIPCIATLQYIEKNGERIAYIKPQSAINRANHK